MQSSPEKSRVEDQKLKEVANDYGRLKWVESQFHADELHVGVDMAGSCPMSLGKIFILGASESAFQCNLSDQLKNFSHGDDTFIYLYICFIFYHKSSLI